MTDGQEETAVVQGEESFWQTTSRYFEKALKHYLPKVNVEPGEVKKVASLGSDTFMEAFSLRRVFRNAEIEGIDRRYTADSTRAIRTGGLIPDDVVLRSANLTVEGSLQPDAYDFLIVRNPDTHRVFNWKLIFRNAFAALKAGGIVFVTGATEEEIDQSAWVLEREKYQILLKERSDNAIPAEKVIGVRDNFVIIARKE